MSIYVNAEKLQDFPDLLGKFQDVVKIIEETKSLVVAFSGGVDSTLLAVISHYVLDDRSLAVTARSAANAKAETKHAEQLALKLNLPHKTVETNELQNPNYSRNDVDRCYHCKSELFEMLNEVLSKENFETISYGLNLDDMGDYRPGVKAGEDYKILAPLKDAKFRKSDIVQMAKLFGLPNWNKPPHPCLSTRFPYGTEITAPDLLRVETAEDFLKTLGLTQFRLRAHGDIARLEIPQEDWHLIMSEATRNQISEQLKMFDFKYVALDLLGYQYGSMNKGLSKNG